MTHMHTENLEVIENFADPFDRASKLEQDARDDSLREIQKRNKQTQSPGPDGVYAITECVECDDDIPLGRLQAAAKNTLCTACASAAERWKR